MSEMMFSAQDDKGVRGLAGVGDEAWKLEMGVVGLRWFGDGDK
jgi:hypothetical protein